MRLNWEKVKLRYQKDPITHAKNWAKFKAKRITETTLFIDLSCREQSRGRKNHEETFKLINKRININNPDYHINIVKIKRSSYAWDILRDMRF